MSRHGAPDPSAITYREWLERRIAQPGTICGPPVIDERAWWQHLPGLNPYADLEQRAQKAERNPAASSRAEAEAG
jgi:hypothetical protein